VEIRLPLSGEKQKAPETGLFLCEIRLSWLRRTQATPLGLATVIAGTGQQVFNPTMAGRAAFSGTTATSYIMHRLSIAGSNTLLHCLWRHFQAVAEKSSSRSNLRDGDCR